MEHGMPPFLRTFGTLALLLATIGCQTGGDQAGSGPTAGNRTAASGTSAQGSPAAPARGPAAVDAARLMAAGSEPANWPTHGGTYYEQHYSTLDQINDGNVGKLELAWYYDLDTNRGQEAMPLVVDGVMYTTSAWSKLFAIDAATGKEIWHYDPEVIGGKAVHACCDVVNRGAALWNGKVFFGTIDGRLIAVDAKTGKPAWQAVTVDQKQAYTITGAPRVVKGKVIIGNSGAEYGVRGYVSAYDAETGKLIWRFYTVPGNPANGPDGAASDDAMANIAAKTWFGQWWKYGGGGTVWDAIVYDPDLDQLYLGVGNGSPWNHEIRSDGKGDNLFTSSIVAVNPDTGKYIWHYQETPGESWDFTATQPIILADLAIGGRPRKVLMQAPKNGFFYVIDRATGKLVSAEKFANVNWAEKIDLKTGRPVEYPEARYKGVGTFMTPAGIGAHAWHPMAYSPKTGLVYIPAMEVPLTYSPDAHFKFRPGRWNTGINFGTPWTGKVVDPQGKPLTGAAGTSSTEVPAGGSLLAWNPVTQKEAWRVRFDHPWNGGALATAGNLVFQGNASREFVAYRADTGQKLWSFDAQAPIVAGASSYSVDGQQYVAVMVGYGGSMGVASPLPGKQIVPPNGRVIAFRIGGGAKLPPYTPELRGAAQPPAETFAPAAVAQGAIRYAENCRVCHAGVVLPDLRRSGVLPDKAAWQEVVIGGVLEPRGMASFRDYLTPAEAETIRAYVASEARALQADQRAGRAQ
jgi:PQQ-dependent dehydrogenase (methanol/ethanol family)